ncbi:MAG TPA: LysM peptidoglycan-binding domain-containing protein [bacterium]|nr:LysM peptidoglycan-binding domain-containing protein [bacterium]
MKTANPFQIPTCLQRNLEQRRQERFKKAVVGSVAAFAALLVALLIAGCMGEHTKSASIETPAVASVSETPPAQEVAVATSKPVVAVQPKPIAAPVVAPAALKTVTSPAISGPETYYVVKPGDTLSRIAKLHQTTVRTLKSVNGLNSDMIAVGAKLKLPTA